MTVMPLQAKFIEQGQALLHGDMHTGSLMVTQDTTYAIDAEFAVYGPIAFDVGKFMANLLLAFFALDGHCTATDTRTKQRAWLYQVLQVTCCKGCLVAVLTPRTAVHLIAVCENFCAQMTARSV